MCVCVCVRAPQDEISELEAKLAGLRQEEARLLTAISEEEGRIEAVHQELEAEDSSLREERDGLSRRDQQLQAEQVRVKCTCTVSFISGVQYILCA